MDYYNPMTVTNLWNEKLITLEINSIKNRSTLDYYTITSNELILF